MEETTSQTSETESNDTIIIPQLTEQQILNCMFSEWYKNFSKVTFKSEIIPLPEDFVQYLLEDGIFVNETDWVKRPKEEDRYDIGEDDWSDNDDDDMQKEPQKPISFPIIEEQIKNAIDKLDGSVFPKLNWSSPKVNE